MSSERKHNRSARLARAITMERSRSPVSRGIHWLKMAMAIDAERTGRGDGMSSSGQAGSSGFQPGGEQAGGFGLQPAKASKVEMGKWHWQCDLGEGLWQDCDDAWFEPIMQAIKDIQYLPILQCMHCLGLRCRKGPRCLERRGGGNIV